MKRLRFAMVPLCAAVGLAAPGCRHGGVAAGARSGASRGDHVARPLIELFSWWTAPGEADALEALAAAHKHVHPEARVFNAAAASGTEARKLLEERLAQDRPPDLFQEYVHDLRATLNGAEKKRVPLDGLFAELRLHDVLFPEVVREVTSEGHVIAMPVDLHRENTLLYNKKIFAAKHLDPPTTIPELLRACKALKAAGIVPIATAAQGWILRIMFNSIAAGRMGTARYRDYFTGKSSAEEAGLRDAIDTFGEVMESYVNPDATEEGFNWTGAAQAVYNGDAAMLLHGDWAKGYLAGLGWKPDVDFGVVASPGATDLFLYGIDVFALAEGAVNERGGREFLATVASIDGQVAFSRRKGSTPIRRDVPEEALDAVGRATLRDFENAKVRMLMRSRPVWEEALAFFAREHDRDALLAAFLHAPPGP